MIKNKNNHILNRMLVGNSTAHDSSSTRNNSNNQIALQWVNNNRQGGTSSQTVLESQLNIDKIDVGVCLE